MAHGRMKGIPEKPKHGKKTVLRLLRYLAGNRCLLAVVMLLVLINIGTGLGASYLMRPIINNYIVPGNADGLAEMLLLLLGVYLLGVVATNIEYRLLNVMGQKTVARIRKDLFHNVQRLPVGYFDKKQYGDLMSLYTNDMDRVSEALTDNLADFITAILTLLGIVGLMLYISPLLTLVCFAILPLMMLAPTFIVKRSKTHFKAQQQALARLNGFVEEKMSGQKVIKVFGAEERTRQQFAGLNHDLKAQSLKAQLFSGAMIPTMQALTTLNFVLVTVVGALLAIVRGLDIGGLATFVQYTRQWGQPMNQLANLYNNLQSAVAGAERIFAVIDEQPEPCDIDTALAPAVQGKLEFQDVWFEYQPHTPILKGINLTIEPGEKVALVGKTGAGKTTFLNLLPRFYDVAKGEIRIDGIPLTAFSRSHLRSIQTIVLQDTHLFAGTVMENIRYGRLDATDQEVIDAARLTSAHSFIRRLPQGYHTLLENDGANLSKGQRQLLSIARSAIANPAILLLDEATSNIDTRSEMLIQNGLDKLMQNRTSIVIAHRLSTVQNADRILVFHNGQIVESGTHAQLLALQGHYFALHTRTFHS